MTHAVEHPTSARTRQRLLVPLVVTVLAGLSSAVQMPQADAHAAGSDKSSGEHKRTTYTNNGRPQLTSSGAVTGVSAQAGEGGPGEAPFAGSGNGLIPSAGLSSPGSEWTRNVESAPVSANSSGLVGNLVQQVTSRYNGVASFNWKSYNVSFATATENTPRTRVIWDNCQNRSYVPRALYDPAYGAHFVNVPIPSTAVPATGTDGELTVWSPSTDQLWEFWKANKQADGWHACWGGRIDRFSTNPGYFQRPMGVAASGLSMAPGVIGIQEMQLGQIEHALGIGLPEVAHFTTFSYPAQRSDGGMPKGTPNAIMEGQRFRLDPSIDVTTLGLTPIAQAVARAAQVYGFIVTDRAGTLAISTENGQIAQNATGVNPWTQLMAGVPSYRILKGFPWHRLQALPVNWGKPKA